MTSATPARKVNLAKVFQNVAGVMAQNETALNEADTLNHDHGTNMAQTFRTIAGAVQERRLPPPLHNWNTLQQPCAPPPKAGPPSCMRMDCTRLPCVSRGAR